MEENGWAVENYTNRVESDSELEMSLDILLPKELDVDNDGYLDIVFVVSPQDVEGYISSSTNDPVSEVFKLKID